MVVYKYMDPQWVEPTIERGQIRIGTLYEYRAQEELCERHDAQEGTSLVSHHIDFATGESMNEFERRFFKPGESVAVVNSDLKLRTSSPNCYVYCMSSELSATAASKYTACVEIGNVSEFLAAVSEVLVEVVRTRLTEVFDRVEYEGREFAYPAPRNRLVAFLKPKRYEFERECRAIWIPEPPSAETKVIRVEELPRGLLRQVPIPR